MLLLVAAAVLLRLFLIQNNWPTTNSDESTMGLMAMHIANKGEFPVFFYGQAYMGSLEAYISSLIFAITGPSLAALRLSLLPFYALFLISIYFLTRLLYTKNLALLTVGLLSVGSSEVILHQLRAIGGYPEAILFGTLTFLLASSLALSSHTGWRRWLLFGLWGLFAGLGVWDDQIILPVLAMSGLLLLLYCRRELWGRGGLALLLGLLLGAAPLLYYNVTAPIEQNSLVVLYSLQTSGVAQLAALPAPTLHQLVGALLLALPAITGLNPLCPPEHLPLFGSAPTWQCSALHGGWTLGYLLLWGSAALLAGKVVWQLWRKRRLTTDHSLSDMERGKIVRQSARLLLLCSAMLTLLLYLRSPASALFPGPTSRYLICMQMATPALLWPLWRRLAMSKQGGAGSLSRPGLFWRLSLLLLISAALLAGTIRTIGQIPSARADYQQKETLIQGLLRLGATRVYSEYFYTCNRLIFQSNERIICSSLDERLQPGFDRYPPYRATVKAAPHPTYVFPNNSAQKQTLEEQLRKYNIPYRRYLFDGYTVYQTDGDIPVP